MAWWWLLAPLCCDLAGYWDVIPAFPFVFFFQSRYPRAGELRADDNDNDNSMYFLQIHPLRYDAVTVWCHSSQVTIRFAFFAFDVLEPCITYRKTKEVYDVHISQIRPTNPSTSNIQMANSFSVGFYGSSHLAHLKEHHARYLMSLPIRKRAFCNWASPPLHTTILDRWLDV